MSGAFSSFPLDFSSCGYAMRLRHHSAASAFTPPQSNKAATNAVMPPVCSVVDPRSATLPSFNRFIVMFVRIRTDTAGDNWQAAETACQHACELRRPVDVDCLALPGSVSAVSVSHHCKASSVRRRRKSPVVFRLSSHQRQVVGRTAGKPRSVIWLRKAPSSARTTAKDDDDAVSPSAFRRWRHRVRHVTS
jgi:hypothetical protein